MSPKHLNFCSTIETDTNMTPHDLYVALSIDAALLKVNDTLPTISDDVAQTVLDAAQAAAITALQLAQVPNDWLDFLAKLHYDRREKVHSELWEIVFELLPDAKSDLSARKDKAEARIMAATHAHSQKSVQNAMYELSDLYMGEVLETIYAAFTLGYQIAHDPTPILFEKVGA